MKRKDFYQLLQPLTDKLYQFAFTFVPDDLQAEQLVIDSFNAFILKEKKNIQKREITLSTMKNSQILRRTYFKEILRYMSEIGARRAQQLTEQMKISRPEEYKTFYSLDPKVRFVISLRYQAQFTVEEIEDIVQMPRYEVIEKLHNGRFLLLNDLNKEITL